MYSDLRRISSLLFSMEKCAEGCVKRNDYAGLVELHEQWASSSAWEDRSWDEQEFLLGLACEVLPKLKRAQYVKPGRIMLFSNGYELPKLS